MSREEFIGYLASRAKDLKIPLRRRGKLLGLPRKFHQALAVACFLDALGQPAPSSEVLRAWYGKEAQAGVETAQWIYRVVGALRGPDLEGLDPGVLMSLWVRFDTWGAMANSLVRDAKRKPRKVHRTTRHHPVTPSKDGDPRRIGDGAEVHGLQRRHTS